MFGKIQLENFIGITKMPQDAASAWSSLEDLIGASYKPLLYLGKQVVKGTNYYFIAEQELMTNPIIRRVVKLAINEFNGEYELVDDSVEEIL
mgnify:CR=1 FL=1